MIFEVSIAVVAALCAVVSLTTMTWVTAELEWMDLQDCTGEVDKMKPL